jgi:hypothetical protein
MNDGIRYRGRTFTERDVTDVRALIVRYPDKSRFFLSKELCRQWNWTQPNGTPKDMVCRGLLLKLHEEGHITLPPARMTPTWLKGPRKPPARIEVDDTPCAIPFAGLAPVSLIPVRRTPFEKLYNGLIEEHHYLGFTRPVGEHLEYIVFSGERPIACIGFGSAPRHIGARDKYLGWSKEERISNLHKIAINTRFLILPWVRVPHLASHLLGQIARRISEDWERIYAHRIIWLETFVDPERGFTGTCYKAANWRYLGLTTGRGKNDQTGKPNRSLKYVFGYPLVKDFRSALYGIL